MSRIRKQAVPIGHRFGRLTVLGHLLYSLECKCDCGTTLYVANCSLVSGRTKSCGCLRKEATAARSKLTDEEKAERAGRKSLVKELKTARKAEEKLARIRKSKVEAEERKAIRDAARKLSRPVSKTRTYKIWIGMKVRCNPATKREDNLKYYVNKGIKVCERWTEFINFLEDMGEAPSGLTIDRINNTRGYEPGNCRWATTAQQNRNTSRNRWLNIGGVSKVLADWCSDTGFTHSQILKISELDDWRTYEP